MAQHHFPPSSHARQDANSKHKHNNRDINLDTDENIISKSLLSEVADSSIILDVRNEDDVSNAKPYDKVPNSVFVKFDKAAGKISDINLSKKLPADKSQSMIVHCYRGNRAGVVAEALEKDGYTNVVNGKKMWRTFCPRYGQMATFSCASCLKKKVLLTRT